MDTHQSEPTAAAGTPAGHTDANLLDLAPNRPGRPILAVRDLDVVARFYQQAIGLSPLGRDGQGLHLGAGGRVLLTLRHDPSATLATIGSAGLYHTAFLLPERTDLGTWLAHARDTAISIDGASDHGVSEAVYLSDPEGNGIEIYADRPSSEWYRPGRFPEMGTAPLDLAGLMRAAAGRRWSRLPDAVCIGHVHLRVGDVAVADAFYADLLGFDVNPVAPTAHFYSTGGYHHQIAVNTWQSRGAEARRAKTTGLVEMQIVYGDARAFDSVRTRLAGDGCAMRFDSRDLIVTDPCGVDIRLTPPG